MYFFEHPIQAKIISLFFFIATLSFLIIKQGLVSGILASSFLWLLNGSLIIIFAPFDVLKYKHIGVITVVIGLIEIFI